MRIACSCRAAARTYVAAWATRGSSGASRRFSATSAAADRAAAAPTNPAVAASPRSLGFPPLTELGGQPGHLGRQPGNLERDPDGLVERSADVAPGPPRLDVGRIDREVLLRQLGRGRLPVLGTYDVIGPPAVGEAGRHRRQRRSECGHQTGSRPAARRRRTRGDVGEQLLDRASGQRAGQESPVIVPSASMSMRKAAGAPPRPGIVRMSPQIG